MIGVDEMTIVNWEKEKTKPTKRNLERLKAIFGATMGVVCAELSASSKGSNRSTEPQGIFSRMFLSTNRSSSL